MSFSQVAIVGRPNVGKSSFLNKLAGKRISIVDPTPGVTRDRIVAEVEWEGTVFEVIDTGGIGIVDQQDLSEHIQSQIDLAVRNADFIMFLVDSKDGLMPLDVTVAEKLRKLNRPVFVVANKSESKAAPSIVPEFFKLGLGDPHMISVKTGHGIDDLLDALVERMKKEAKTEKPREEKSPMKIAIVGKRNAGKSTLVNLLAGEERVIVSEIPGTTRDAVDVRIEREGMEPFVVIDTAGVRKKKSVQDSIEFFSLVRSEEAMRRADVVLLLFDCNTELTEVDKKLARYIQDHHKPCIIAASKWDLSRADTKKFEDYIRGKLTGLRYAPISFLSSLENINIWETVRLALELYAQAGTKIPTGQLNKALDAARDIKMPAAGGRVAKLFYGTQVDVYPPTILLFVNEPKLFGKEYDRFLQNRLRERSIFPEVPIRILYRRREKVSLD